MRLSLILVLGLLSGCITTSETDNAGMKTTRHYVLFIPVSKRVTQSPAHQAAAVTTSGPTRQSSH
jgi:hypothetical protein